MVRGGHHDNRDGLRNGTWKGPGAVVEYAYGRVVIGAQMGPPKGIKQGLQLGITNNIRRRVRQHKDKQVAGFTKRYNITRLLYYECFRDVNAAIAHEKRIKGWVRQKKLDLIVSVNPDWNDLSDDWYD
jgi:putative endonuclease